MARLTSSKKIASDPEVVVSMTTYPTRLPFVKLAMESILRQTVRPDHLVLSLARDEFPGGNDALPPEIVALRNQGVEILWAEQNIRPHKKYFQAMRKYPDAVVITVDDDKIYPPTLVADLLESYHAFPKCVSAMRTHLMTFTEDGRLRPYLEWQNTCSAFVRRPNFALMAIGAGGILYPPHLLPEQTFDISSLNVIAPLADDIWLKFMEVLNGIPVVLASQYGDLAITIDGSQGTALCKTNQMDGANDAFMANAEHHVLLAAGKSILKFIWEEQSLPDLSEFRKLISAYGDLAAEKRKAANLYANERAKFAAFEKSNKQLLSDVSGQKGAVAKLTAESDAAKKQLTQQAEAIKKLTDELAAAKKLTADLTTRAKAAETALAAKTAATQQMDQARSRLQAEVEQLKADASARTEQMALMKAALQFAQMKANAANDDAKLIECRKDLDDLRRELRDAQDDRIRRMDELSALKVDAEVCRTTLRFTQTSLDEERMAHASTREAVSRLTTELAERKAELESSAAQREIELKALESSKVAVFAEVARQKESVSKLTAAKAAAETEAAQKAKALIEAEEKLVANEKACQELLAKIDELGNQLETNVAQSAAQAEQVVAQAARIKELEEALAGERSWAEQRVESLTADISGLRGRASAAEKKVAEAAGCLSGLEKRLTESENCRQLEKRAHQRFSSESYERGKELKRVQADLIKLQEVCCDLDKSRALADAAYDKLAKSKLGRLTIRYWKLKDGKRGGEHSIRKSRSIRSALEEALRQLLSVKVKIPTCDAAKTAPVSRLSPVASSAQKRSEARVVGLATAQWKDFKAEQIRVSRMIEPELRKSGEVAEADRLRTGIRIAEGQMTVGSPASKAASRRTVEGRLKVATILDTFSDSCFGAECDLVRITPENWRDVLTKERPDMLLVESAWNGNGGSWQYLIGTYAGSTRDKLRELLQGCRELGIPTAFWNKEDPPHFDKFIEAASLFDHVFTTDENCIPKYRKMCGHDRVSALPFAAAPTIHNPIVEGPRDRDVCFAGTYYANRFEDRRKQMDVLLECAHGFNFDIYDRMFGNKNPGFENYLFPEKFRPYIRGKLDYADMLKAYRRYRFFLNTNSVVDSGTMFSRRVFELLACGTPVITTPSVGIQRFFGGIVDEITSVEDGRKRMSRLLADKVYYRDLQIRGIREVLGKHTYAIRLEQMARDLGFVYRRPTAVIAVFAVIGKSGSASVVETLGRQTVRPKLVVLRACDEKYSSDIRKAGFDVMISDRLDSVALSRAGVNFAVWMDFGLKYGKDYLLDASLNVQFERGHVSGMRATHEMEFRMAEDFMAPTVAVSSDRWKETAQVMDGLFLNGLKGVATLHGYNRPETEFSRG